jgi:hypothetical protein
MLSGPFTEQIHDPDRWQSWAGDLGGEPIHLVWVRSDEATLRHRLATRGLERDSSKLAGFAAFTARMRPGTEPAVPHLAIDNRLSSATTLQDQVAALIARLPGQPATHGQDE